MLYNQYLQELHEAYIHYQNTNNSASPEEQKEHTGATTEAENDARAQTNSLEHFDIKQVPEEIKSSVMLRFKGKLGGRERRITTGGAPTGKLVKRFLIECFDGMVSEGYGSTEVS